jgi:hypothetical protein
MAEDENETGIIANVCEPLADSFGRMGGKARCGLLTCCLSFMAIVVICAVSIEGVEPTEFAVIKNNVN